MLLKFQQTRSTEILQGRDPEQVICTFPDLCLLLLLAASGSLQAIYLHLGNSYSILHTHQQFTLTQKNSFWRSEETVNKIITFFFLLWQMSDRAFLKKAYLIFSYIVFHIQLPFQKQNKTKLGAQMQTNQSLA